LTSIIAHKNNELDAEFGGYMAHHASYRCLSRPAIEERWRHNLDVALDRPSKGYPDYRSRVVSEKSNDVRPRIELTANVEGE
jgi:hypothetical protein